MYEKILQKLKEARDKNSQVTDATLTSVATMLATYITTDEQLTTLSATEVLGNVQQNINSIAKEAVEKIKPKPVEKPTDPVTPPATPPAQTGSAEILALQQQIQAMQTQIQTMSTATQEAQAALVTAKRQSIMEALVKDLPEARRKELLEDYGMMSFSDDTAFNSFITRKQPSIAKEVEEAAATALDFSIAANAAQFAKEAKEPEYIQQARKMVQPVETKKEE